MSLKDELLNVTKNRYPELINGREFEQCAENLGHKASNASRRMRELCNEGKVERILRPMANSLRVSVWYRYKPVIVAPPKVLPQFRREVVRTAAMF